MNSCLHLLLLTVDNQNAKLYNIVNLTMNLKLTIIERSNAMRKFGIPKSPRKKKSFSKIKEKNKSLGNLLDLILIALFSSLVAICSQIAIPSVVPFTLQTMGVFITASLLGCKRGTMSIIIYILLGTIGLPVFSGFSGGIGRLIGPTGGYIIGFIFTAVAVGLLTERFGKKLCVLAVSMLIGLILCYTVGTVWFCISAQTDFVSALTICVIPFLIADIAKIMLASVLVNRLEKIIEL